MAQPTKKTSTKKSTKKSSFITRSPWSRRFFGAIGVIILIVLGFTGFSLYQNLGANAGDKSTLGRSQVTFSSTLKIPKSIDLSHYNIPDKHQSIISQKISISPGVVQQTTTVCKQPQRGGYTINGSTTIKKYTISVKTGATDGSHTAVSLDIFSGVDIESTSHNLYLVSTQYGNVAGSTLANNDRTAKFNPAIYTDQKKVIQATDTFVLHASTFFTTKDGTGQYYPTIPSKSMSGNNVYSKAFKVSSLPTC